jgi:6-phosphogluconolactonase (cycloisomerase 2 family)
MLRVFASVCGACFALAFFSQSHAQDLNRGGSTLHFVAQVTRPDLRGVNSVTISQDGQFLYATPWPIGAVVVFKREATQGGLEHVQTVQDDRLRGDTGLALSPREDYAIAACFQAHSAVLLRRDGKNGKLEIVDSAFEAENGVSGLGFAIDAIFSPDGRFIYVLDGGMGGIAIFALRDGKLHFVSSEHGTDECLEGARGVALDPSGKTMYVASDGAGTLTVLARNVQTGLLKVQQVIADEKEGVHGLEGAFGVTCSGDGQFIYTTSGRFHGDNAVGVFHRNDDGRLVVVQELIAPHGGLSSFRGGNRVRLSADEKNAYAVASQSGSLACFSRDGKSGRLKLTEMFDQEKQTPVQGAADVTVSPDGKHVYVAAEGGNAISIFRRE